MLEAYGEYPAKYRPLVWRFLLQLPENADAHAWLKARGEHAHDGDLARIVPHINALDADELTVVSGARPALGAPSRPSVAPPACRIFPLGHAGRHSLPLSDRARGGRRPPLGGLSLPRHPWRYFFGGAVRQLRRWCGGFVCGAVALSVAAVASSVAAVTAAASSAAAGMNLSTLEKYFLRKVLGYFVIF